MKRLSLTAIVFLLALAYTAHAQNTRVTAEGPFARLAALRFMQQSGFVVPDSTAVVIETYGTTRQPRPAATRAELRDADARAIAAEVGKHATTGAATELVTCASLVCWPRVDRPVLILGDPGVQRDGRHELLVELYTSNGDGTYQLKIAVVQLRGADGAWVANAFSLGPSTLRRTPRTLKP